MQRALQANIINTLQYISLNREKNLKKMREPIFMKSFTDTVAIILSIAHKRVFPQPKAFHGSRIQVLQLSHGNTTGHWVSLLLCFNTGFYKLSSSTYKTALLHTTCQIIFMNRLVLVLYQRYRMMSIFQWIYNNVTNAFTARPPAF